MSPKRELNPESSPAARFGFEVRKRRMAAHLTQEQLGDKIGYTGAMVSMVETGQRMPKSDFADACDALLELNGGLVRLWEMCRSDGAQRWFVPWLEAEQNASVLQTWQPNLVPGLLQTAAYARALFLGVPGMHPSALDKAVASRIERQAIFERDDPPMLLAVLDEVVLQRPVGGPAVMRGQLEHLLTMGEHRCITLQIVPLATGSTAGLLGAFSLAQAQGHEQAYLESSGEGTVTASLEDVQKLHIRYDAIRAQALPQEGSQQMIKEWVQRWTS